MSVRRSWKRRVQQADEGQAKASGIRVRERLTTESRMFFKWNSVSFSGIAKARTERRTLKTAQEKAISYKNFARNRERNESGGCRSKEKQGSE